jgi:general secretion pathway protein A
MYHQYFGLSEAPFSIAVNPRYLFMSARHRDALAHLLYGVGAGGGFILLTGEVGTGKTTINRCLLEQLPEETDIAIILNPALNSLELLATACDELHIEYDPDNYSLKTLTDKLHAYLLDNHSRGRNTVLMIDEAQHLDFEVLEQIRLLTNLETNTRKLLQIILIGQPELVELLNRPELRQLNQRITARYNLEPLNLEETSAYIRHRLQVAGLAPGRELFPASVVRGIFKRTRGIPRLINVLCDRILLGAYGRNKLRADTGMLQLAAREVMGEQPHGAPGGAMSGAVVAGLSMALVILAIGLWYVADRDTAGVVPNAHRPQAESSTAVVPAQAATAAASTPAAPTLEATAQEAARNPGEQAQQSSWLLPPQAALSRLWSLVSVGPLPAGLCGGDPVQGIACIEQRAQTWEALRAFDRPVALQMVTPARFGASVLILGIENADAYVFTDSGLLLVGLGELGALWSGYYNFLWRPPADFQSPLTMGDNDPVVARVSNMFARLDGQSSALSANQFNAALKERVVLFQRQHGLEDDGVVGVQTLLKLNEQLGIDPTAASARALLEQAAQEVVLR